MSNINNSFGTNGAYGGRTSVEAFNDVLSLFNDRGVLSGWGLEPAGGMSVNVGGASGVRDVAIALDNQGNKTTVNNISKQPITITLPSAPASGTRKDNIVAYINKPVNASDTTLDNPSAVNVLITSASSDSDIRSAITQDGGTGANAYYVILGSITVPSGTTDITADMITSGAVAGVGAQNIDATYVVLYPNANVSVPGNNNRTIIPLANIKTSGGNWNEYFAQKSNGSLDVLKDCAVEFSSQIYAGTAIASGRVGFGLYNNTASREEVYTNTGAVNAAYLMYVGASSIVNLTAGQNISFMVNSSASAFTLSAGSGGQTFARIKIV